MSKSFSATSGVPPAQQHIETVASLEREFLEERTWADRLADIIGGFSGTIYFVLLHLCWFALWLLINTGHFPSLHIFDPYPFILLSMMVSVEAVLLATFVLMMQNRMVRRTNQRDHLNLQIDLLAEKEITKMLQMQRAICQHLGIAAHLWADAEVAELSQETSVDRLARDIKAKLDTDEARDKAD